MNNFQHNCLSFCKVCKFVVVNLTVVGGFRGFRGHAIQHSWYDSIVYSNLCSDLTDRSVFIIKHLHIQSLVRQINLSNFSFYHLTTKKKRKRLFSLVWRLNSKFKAQCPQMYISCCVWEPGCLYNTTFIMKGITSSG